MVPRLVECGKGWRRITNGPDPVAGGLGTVLVSESDWHHYSLREASGWVER
jgi:hypothetical protein